MVEREHVLVLAKRKGYRQTVRPTRSTRTSTRVESLVDPRRWVTNLKLGRRRNHLPHFGSAAVVRPPQFPPLVRW